MVFIFDTIFQNQESGAYMSAPSLLGDSNLLEGYKMFHWRSPTSFITLFLQQYLPVQSLKHLSIKPSKVKSLSSDWNIWSCSCSAVGRAAGSVFPGFWWVTYHWDVENLGLNTKLENYENRTTQNLQTHSFICNKNETINMLELSFRSSFHRGKPNPTT